MTTHPREQLSDFVDGTLDPERHREVTAHVATCAACADVVADLRVLAAAATAWGAADHTPARDLWPGIAARLASTDHAVADISAPAPAHSDHPRSARPPVPWYRRRWEVGVPDLALAATVLVAVAGTGLYLRPAPPRPLPEAPAPIIAEIEAVGPPEGTPTPVSFADAQYDAAVHDLERVLVEQRDRLNPRTIIVLERNLRTIDDAIREARRALDQDPANTLLNTHLASARRRKLDLLRRAALITEAN
jgi:Putative zinc-finger